MTVVALCGAARCPRSAAQGYRCTGLRSQRARLPRIHEAHQVVLHCICDGVDVQLLGEDEPEEFVE